MTQDQTTSPSPEPVVKRVKRRGFWQAMLLSVVIFISGGACGWGVCLLMGPRHGPGPVGMMPDPPVEDIVRAMRHELLLSDQQASQLTEIYKKRFGALEAIRGDMLPKFRTQYDGLRGDVEKVLTPEQFKRWSVRFDAVRNKMMPPPPRGGPMEGSPGPGQGRQHQGPPPEGGPPPGGPGPDDGGPPDGPPPR